MTRTENTNSRVWLGLLLVLLGSYFLLKNLQMIPAFLPSWLFDWEMIFVLIGGTMLLTGKREGFIFLGIGLFFVVPDILGIPDLKLRHWWPVILIAFGISIFLKRNRIASQDGVITNEEYFDDTSLFGGSSKTITSQNLKSARISSVFGGSEINLSSAKMGQNEVVVDCLCLFGGNEIIVPQDWTVINEMTVIFGGFSDQRPVSAKAGQDPNKVIRLKGLILFGGSEVKGA